MDLRYCAIKVFNRFVFNRIWTKIESVWELQNVVAKFIICVATILFTYTSTRSFSLIFGTEAEFNRKLARDLEWGRMFLNSLT